MLLLKPWDVLQILACRRQGRISMGVAKRKRKTKKRWFTGL